VTGGSITGSGQYGVTEIGAGLTVAQCTTVTGNHGGVLVSSSGAGQTVSISDSSLYGNLTSSSVYDLQIEGVTTAVTANGNWWGQAGGPQSGQISPSGFTDSSPLSTAPSC
jgi:hypothetical protein